MTGNMQRFTFIAYPTATDIIDAITELNDFSQDILGRQSSRQV